MDGEGGGELIIDPTIVAHRRSGGIATGGAGALVGRSRAAHATGVSCGRHC